MNKLADRIIGLTAGIGMVVLIIDCRSAISAAADGIELCIRTLIPSLFPFLFLCGMLSSSLSGRSLVFLRPLARICRLPEGSEYIFLSGLIGGYPVGAISIAEAHRSGSLTTSDARRMLAFCNNCGPAFLFGVSAVLFDAYWVPWVLLAIHIVSAIGVAVIIPGDPCHFSKRKKAHISPVGALNQAVRSMASICGWVIIFRILLDFLLRWIGWYFPEEIQVAISGLLELSNGCLGLVSIENVRLRLILCAGILGFGGLCVTMQTLSVAKNVPKDLYFPGKLLHCCISISLASALCASPMGILPGFIGTVLAIFLRNRQKICRNIRIIDV